MPKIDPEDYHALDAYAAESIKALRERLEDEGVGAITVTGTMLEEGVLIESMRLHPELRHDLCKFMQRFIDKYRAGGYKGVRD